MVLLTIHTGTFDYYRTLERIRVPSHVDIYDKK